MPVLQEASLVDVFFRCGTIVMYFVSSFSCRIVTGISASIFFHHQTPVSKLEDVIVIPSPNSNK